MEKIFKKSLALVLSAALCLTALVGCLTVSAAETDNSATVRVGSVTVNSDATKATVPVTITATGDGIAAAMFELKVDTNKIYLSGSWADVATNIKTGSNTVGLNVSASHDGDNVTTVASEDVYRFIVEGVNPTSGENVSIKQFTNASFDLIFNIASGVTGENVIEFVNDKHAQACNAGTFNADGTYTGNEKPFTLTGTDGAVTVGSTHEHSWDAGTVTLRPTTTETGVRTFKCTGCDVTKTETIPVATVVTTADDPQTNKVGHNLAVQNSIEISFNIRNAYIKDAVDYYAVFTKEYYDIHGNVTGTDKITKESTAFTYYNENQKSVRYDKLAAKELGTKLTAEIYAELSDGSFKCIVDEYRITKYIDSVIAAYATSSKAKEQAMMRLAIDLVNYGAAAQVNFNYNTDNLANAAYSDYQSFASPSVPKLTTISKSIDNDGATIKLSRQLNLASSICVVAALQNLDNSAYLDDMTNFKAKCVYTNQSGVEQEPLWIDSSEFIYLESDGKYAINFNKFTALQSTHKVVITLYSGDKIISNTIEYSIESYAYVISKNLPETDKLRALTDSMIKYCKAAEAYFAL